MNDSGWMRKKWLWVTAGLIVLVAVAAVPAYRQVKIWRAEAMAQEASLLMEDPESLIRAWELAHAASALHPSGLEVTRVLAQVYALSDPAGAPAYWQRVVELSADPEDRYAFAESALNAGQWAVFEAQLRQLSTIGFPKHRILLLRARAAAIQGDYPQALTLVAKVLEHDKQDIAADLLYVQLTQLSDDAAVRAEGVAHLWELALSDDRTKALAAVDNLSRAPELSVADTEKLVERIDALAGDEIELTLLAREIALRLPNAEPAAVAADAAALFALEDDVQLLQLARWLNRVGLAEATIEYLPESRALTRQDLFLVRADALALLNRWQEVGALLNQPRVPVEDYLRAFFQMRVRRETGQPRQAKLEWQRALLLAAHEAERVYYLAEKSHMLGERVFYRQALERMTEINLLRRAGYEGLIGYYYDAGDSQALFDVLQQTTNLFADNSAVRNDFLYVGFLTGKLGSDYLQEAQTKMVAQPGVLAFRMTYAMGLVRHGFLERAYAVLAEAPVDWRTVSDRWKVLVVHVLAEAGQAEEAEELLRAVKKERLLPEELKWVNRIEPNRCKEKGRH